MGRYSARTLAPFGYFSARSVLLKDVICPGAGEDRSVKLWCAARESPWTYNENDNLFVKQARRKDDCWVVVGSHREVCVDLYLFTGRDPYHSSSQGAYRYGWETGTGVTVHICSLPLLLWVP